MLNREWLELIALVLNDPTWYIEGDVIEGIAEDINDELSKRRVWRLRLGIKKEALGKRTVIVEG